MPVPRELKREQLRALDAGAMAIDGHDATRSAK